MSEQAKTRISVSQVDTFLNCPQKWFLTYKKGLSQLATEIGPASLGDVVHVGLAAALRSYWQDNITSYEVLQTKVHQALNLWDMVNRPDKKTIAVDGSVISIITDDAFFAEWDVMLTDAEALVMSTLKNLQLIEKYAVVDVFMQGNGHEVDPYYEPLIEFKIVQEIPDTNFEFAGVVDAVLRNRFTDMIEVIDWKVRGKFTGLESEQLSSQIGIYQHALRQMGIDAPVGVVYQIRNEPPKKPKLNKEDKNGVRAMSRQKIATDWITYKAALIEAGLDPADYEDEMLPKLAETEFFRPLMVIRTEATTTALWENMVEHAHRISEETRFPKAYGYPCRFCPFRQWCQSELYGYDTEALIGDVYEIKTYTPNVNEEAE